MKTIISILSILLLVTIHGFGVQLPTDNSQGRHFTDENGLPQNSITGMAFDNMGFIWIATQGGLARLDGQEMKIFTKEKLSVDSDRFVKLKTDVFTSALYAVNEYGQMVSIRDGNATRERHYRAEDALDIESISPSRMNGIRLDTTKTSDGYLKYRVTSTISSGRYFVYAGQKVMFFRNSVMSKAIDFPGEPFFNPFPGEPNVRATLVAQTKKLICVDNFMTISGELFYHKGSEGSRFLHLSERDTAEVSLRGDIRKHALFAKEEGKIRIVTNRMRAQAFAVLGESIYYVTYTGSGQALQTRLLIENFKIDDNLVSRMLYDEANSTLILGSFSQGLLLLRTKMFQVLSNTTPENFHNVFYSHLPFSASSVIIPDGIVMGAHDGPPSDGEMFRTREPTIRFSMLRDKQGHYWIFKKDTLFQLNAAASQSIAEWHLDWQPQRVYQSPSGDIWVGSKTGEVYYLKPGATSADKPVTVIKLNGESTFIYQQKPRQMWFGTTAGLYFYNISKRTLYPVKGLAKKTIRSIYATGKDELWITTYGDGMYLITENKLIRLPLDEHGYLRHAHYLMEDQQKNFWIPTNKGLFRASKDDLLAYASGQLHEVFYAYYNKDDGFLINEFNGGCQPCGAKLADGRFSLPSMSGLVWFRPDEVKLPSLRAPIIFENLTIGNKSVMLKDTMRLTYDFARLKFDVRTPFNGTPDNLQLYYRLEQPGSPKPGWTRLAAGKQIDLYQTNAGNYILRVRKTTGFGGQYVEKSMVLIVEKAWFFSLWFIALLTLALLGLFWLFSKWRFYNLTRQNMLLGQKVEERTHHLTRALNDLKASDNALQMQLQIQMRIIGVINHDLHSPLRYLSTQVPRFMDQVIPYLPDPETIGLSSAISKSTVKVYRLADELLGFIKATYNKRGRITYEAVQLKEILNQKALFFAELARENETVLTADCDSRLLVNTNYQMVEILIHNLLDNALKHTYSKSVNVTARAVADKKVEVIVSDSGYGMYDEITGWLNEKPLPEGDARVGNAASLPGNLGLGLIIVKEIAALLDIEIAASSSNEGTRVALIFSEKK